MPDDRPRGSCVINGCPRDPYPVAGGRIPLVCGPHVSQMRTWLLETPRLCADLEARNAPEEVVWSADVRVTPSAWHPPMAPGVLVVQVERLLVAAALPAAMTPGAARGGRVTGSAEPRLPIRVDDVDLLAPARSIRRTTSEDDIGFLSVASTLDFWVQDLRDHRGRGEGLPEPSVMVLARWLADRIDEAAADWLPIDEFFEDLYTVHGGLRGGLGLFEPRKQELIGIPCASCDVRLLVRAPGSDYVECEACGHLLTEDEYAAWCKTLLAEARKSVTPSR